MSILEFIGKVTDIAECVQFLRQCGLLLKQASCTKCLYNMTLTKKGMHVTHDGEQWQCYKCRTSLSIRHGSIFKVNIVQ